MTQILNNNILLLSKSQEFKEYLINEGFKALSILKGVITSNVITAPPGSPDPDDFYIVPTGATGDWAGKTNQIAYPATDYNGNPTGWQFYSPYEGLFLWLVGTGMIYYDGTDWQNTSITPESGVIPSQASQSGKYLKTSGGVAAWEFVQNEVFTGLILGETTTPTTGADQVKLYAKADGRIYYRKESDGNEHLLKEDKVIPFFIPAPIQGTIVRYRNRSSAKVLVEANHQSDSGASQFTVAIDGTPVTGLTGITSNTSDTTTAASGANTVAAGAIVSITYDSVTTPFNSRIQLYLRDA
jgi:hypothetical protein